VQPDFAFARENLEQRVALSSEPAALIAGGSQTYFEIIPSFTIRPDVGPSVQTCGKIGKIVRFLYQISKMSPVPFFLIDLIGISRQGINTALQPPDLPSRHILNKS
jgi:hypothetical protein